MAEVIRVALPAEPEALAFAGDLTAVPPEQLDRHRPDAHFVCVENGELRARCSVWWRDAPPLAGEKLGAVGHFAAADEGSARAVLDAAAAALAGAGCTLAAGPMDGNTWRSYRLVTDFGADPPFLLEPWNPLEWPLWFEAAGFVPLARYHSLLFADLSRDPAPKPLPAGVRLRALDPARFDDELKLIFRLSVAGFARNYLYTPLAEADFLSQYLPFRERIVPEVNLIAEVDGEPAGFIFCYPDLLEAQRLGAAPRTLVLKSLAVLPAMQGHGLGGLLVAHARAAGRALGYSRAIHALMLDENVSTKISRASGQVMRRYTLFARRLAGA
ncbi:MAG TPA: GNAT family N-acetyltransferase [Pelomicrobium sp.]|nr:GNAT family N-acetyltransferase [Pelomicrobium sp.]